MLISVMDFKPRFEQRFQHAKTSGALLRRTLSLLDAPHRQGVKQILERGDAISLLLFEVQDFYIFSKIYGQEVADALSLAMERELSALVRDMVQGLPFILLERMEGDKLLLALGSSQTSMDTLTHTAAILRLNLRARIKRESLNLTGQDVEIAVGVAQLHPGGARKNLEQAVHAALADAHRMIRGSLDHAAAGLLKEFRSIMEGGRIRALYQPIVDLRGGGIFAWEALARGPAGGTFESPAMLFGFAEEHDLVFPLEQACRHAAIRAFQAPGQGKLFLNVHPRTLVDPSFNPGETLKLLEDSGLEPHDVVLEITERHSTKDFSLFHRTLDHYRSEGYKVAVDDVGTGYSGLWSIAEIRPDFIKLDMSLVRGIDANPVKRALIETFLTFSDKVGCKIIAEGIETPTELSSLVSMGVHFGQGYYLARPGAPLPAVAPDAAQLISVGCRRSAVEIKCSSPIGIHALDAVSVQATTHVGEVKRFLEAHTQLSSVAVVAGTRPVGLVTRHQMDRVLSSQYGLALYTNRPITRVMDSHPLIVDWSTPVEVVAQAAMNREGYKVYDHVLVTREGRLVGLASVQNILDALAQVQMEMAKGANPLSGLPGNVAIEREVEQRVASDQPVSFIYADLDNFKVYNDSYGFKAGDEIILLAARILSWAVRRHGSSTDFVGHVGGDDFVACTTPERAERICQAVTRCFARLVRLHHDEADLAAGFITGKDREGNEGRFGLVSISLAIVDCAGYCSLASISQRSAEMKKYAKSKPGNVWVRDRRGPVVPGVGLCPTPHQGGVASLDPQIINPVL